MTRIHVVDASPYIFRAYFSLPGSIADPEGRPVQAVYGFAHTLLRMIEDDEATHVAVTFDRSLTSSFRNEIYPPYKQQRELPPAELEAQLDRSLRIAEALGCPTFIDDRYEADDLMAALVDRLDTAEDDGPRFVLVTSDKDLAQLVGPRCELWDLARDERYGTDEIRDKFGVRPEQIRDYLGLAGDSVDNIPGVKGVGKKTAVALLEAFSDLEAIYADLEGVAGLAIRGAKSVARKLEEHRESAFLSRRLATVAVEAPAEATVGELEWRGPDAAALEAICAECGFDRLPARAAEVATARGVAS